jgi:hypothetical protein
MPRRWLDFESDWIARRDDVTTAVIGWSLLATVFALTVWFAILRWRQARAVTGAPAAFLLLGAYMCCFHFMYYDVLLSALPVFLLFTEPWRYVEKRFFSIRQRPWAVNRMIPSLVTVLIVTPAALYPLLGLGAFNVPADAICLILIWLWCGWLWWREPMNPDEKSTEFSSAVSRLRAPKFVEFGADVDGAHERLADQNRPDTGRLQA